jgi:pSer/pThr/pTyr-binding forkhead associated (FHA) protein
MDTSRSRPFGVTLAAILFLAIAFLSLFVAARYVLSPASNEEMLLLFTRLKIPVTFLNLLAAPPLICAGLATLLFRGLWEEQAWARVAVVMFSFIAMLAALALIAFFQVFNIGSRAVWSAVGAFILFTMFFIYFLKSPWPGMSEAASQPAPISPHVSTSPATPPTASPPPPPPPPAAPPLAPAPPELYDARHSAPTLMADVELTQGAATVRIEPETSEPLACLIVLSGPDSGKQFEILNHDILIGRHPVLADALLTDPTVSARHARIHYEAGRFIFSDLGSTNGSFINQRQVQTQELRDQDRIWLGAVELLFTTTCQD